MGLRTKHSFTAAVLGLLQACSIAPVAKAKLGETTHPQKEAHLALERPEISQLPTKNDKYAATIHIVGGDDTDERIVGGEDVTGPEVYPFFVSWAGLCGGSLIHSDIVLTAAHCDVISSNTLTIGAYELDNPNTPGAEVRTIVERKGHPAFNSFTLHNDFLLLKLDSPVTTIQPISLNTDEFSPATGESLTVIGLGTLSEGGVAPTVLQQVTVDTVSDQDCDSSYAGYPFQAEIMFCAGVNGGGKDSCQGDSGGPIFTVTGSGAVDKQVGIVSWGLGCARPDKPGIYAEISAVEDWISSEICALSGDRPAYCPPPTPAPTPVPPAEGEVAVDVNVVTDRFPQEIGWSIASDSGAIVASVSPGFYTVGEELHTTTVNLEIGLQYTFEIIDTFGDGICCNFGMGSYSVEAGSSVLASGSQYGASEATTFVAPGSFDMTPGPELVPVVVTIVFDIFPKETGWSIVDEANEIVVEVPPLSYMSEDLNTTTVYLEEGQQYTFEITDEYGDGICCSYGDGSYTVAVGDVVLASGSQFGFSEATTFVVPGVSDLTPPGDTIEMSIIILTDEWPLEVQWFLLDKTGVLVSSSPLGSYDTPNELYSTVVSIESGTEYNFTIVDKAGDGLCCGYGEGNYSLVAGDVILASGAIYGDFETTIFVAPEAYDVETCFDTSIEFIVDAIIGTQGCEWLSVHLPEYPWLCQFVDVAVACPVTCDICDHLSVPS